MDNNNNRTLIRLGLIAIAAYMIVKGLVGIFQDSHGGKVPETEIQTLSSDETSQEEIRADQSDNETYLASSASRKRSKERIKKNTKKGNDQVSQAKAKASKEAPKDQGTGEEALKSYELDEDGIYTSKDEVAWYLHTYGRLPSNYITKKEAEKKGWSRGEYLGEVLPGKSIGGDRFGNYEGQLPEKKGRSYKECDIDYSGKARNAKRIVFSNDGLIYYTADHYNTFEQLF